MGGEQYAEWNYTGSVTINSGATLTVATNAVLNWNNGGVEGDLTVAQGGVLNLTNNATYSIYGALTNNGTVNWFGRQHLRLRPAELHRAGLQCRAVERGI